MSMMGGMHPGLLPGVNSGHVANAQHLYGAHPAHHGMPGPGADRPFKCDQCPQSFNRNHDLKRHKRIHLAVKPFPCSHCDKSFSRKDALKVGCPLREDFEEYVTNFLPSGISWSKAVARMATRKPFRQALKGPFRVAVEVKTAAPSTHASRRFQGVFRIPHRICIPIRFSLPQHPGCQDLGEAGEPYR